jgi:hypothetical protein
MAPGKVHKVLDDDVHFAKSDDENCKAGAKRCPFELECNERAQSQGHKQ